MFAQLTPLILRALTVRAVAKLKLLSFEKNLVRKLLLSSGSIDDELRVSESVKPKLSIVIGNFKPPGDTLAISRALTGAVGTPKFLSFETNLV